MATVSGAQVRPVTRGRFNIGLTEALEASEGNDQRGMRRVTDRECRRLASSGAAAAGCEQEIAADMGRMLDQTYADSRASLSGLEDMLTRLALIDGPKSVIVLSEGLVLEQVSDLDNAVRLTAMGVFTRCGGIEVARTEERMHELRRRLSAAHAYGVDAEMLTPAGVKALMPYLDDTTPLDFIELALLLTVGREVGVLPTVGMIILTAVSGAALAVRAEHRALRSSRAARRRGMWVRAALAVP